MLPRITKERGAQITIAMPLPKSIPKDWFNLDSWRSLYEAGSIASTILYLAKEYNAYIIDVGIMWLNAEFYFEMCFSSRKEVNSFKKDISIYICCK